MVLAEQLGSFAGQLTETGIRAVDDRIRGRGRRAQHQAADRDRADRAPGAAARVGQHGQRAADLPAARHPGQRDPARRGRRLPEPDAGHGHHRAARARPSPAPSLPATSRASSTSRAFRSRPSSGATCCSCATTTSPALSARSVRRWRRREVNIATFHLGRTAPGEDAIALVEVDQKLTDILIDTVRRLPNVIQAKAMRF